MAQPISTPSQPHLETGRILNESDAELFAIAEEVAFSIFDLRHLSVFLLKVLGCELSGEIFLSSLQNTPIASQTHDLLKYWVRGAPRQRHRYGEQLKHALRKMERHDVICSFQVYLDGGCVLGEDDQVENAQSPPSNREPGDRLAAQFENCDQSKQHGSLLVGITANIIATVQEHPHSPQPCHDLVVDSSRNRIAYVDPTDSDWLIKLAAGFFILFLLLVFFNSLRLVSGHFLMVFTVALCSLITVLSLYVALSE